MPERRALEPFADAGVVGEAGLAHVLGYGPVVGGKDVVGRPLEDGELGGVLSDDRDCLHRAGAGADDADPLPGEVDGVMGPQAGVVALAAERVRAGERRGVGHRQCPDGGDEVVGLDALARVGRDRPQACVFVEGRGLHSRVEGDVAEQVVPLGDVLEVGAHFMLLGIALGPPPFLPQLLVEHEAVDVAVGVAAGARVPVPPPRPAHAAASLDHACRQAHLVAELVEHVQAREPRADDHGVEGCHRLGCRHRASHPRRRRGAARSSASHGSPPGERYTARRRLTSVGRRAAGGFQCGRRHRERADTRATAPWAVRRSPPSSSEGGGDDVAFGRVLAVVRAGRRRHAEAHLLPARQGDNERGGVPAVLRGGLPDMTGWPKSGWRRSIRLPARIRPCNRRPPTYSPTKATSSIWRGRPTGSPRRTSSSPDSTLWPGGTAASTVACHTSEHLIDVVGRGNGAEDMSIPTTWTGCFLVKPCLGRIRTFGVATLPSIASEVEASLMTIQGTPSSLSVDLRSWIARTMYPA